MPILWAPDEPFEAPTYDWIVGVDFGTSKTALFITDCSVCDQEPLPVLWDHHGALVPKVDSIMMYKHGVALPVCGYQVPFTPERDAVVISAMKMELQPHEGAEQMRWPKERDEVIADYLRFLINQVRRDRLFTHLRNPLHHAAVVMSLPVLAGERYAQQREHTLRAAVLAGLRPEQLFFYTEPECAAVDFIRHRQEWELALDDGQILCIFDCGAGTTDIHISRIELQEDGSYTFKTLAQTGFPIGGTLVDELLADRLAAVMQLERAGEGGGYAVGGMPLERKTFVERCRLAKEQLAFPGADDDAPCSPVELLGKRAAVDWQMLDELFRPYLEEMLTGLFTDRYGATYPCLGDALLEAQIDPGDVNWLCLTGGSATMPVIIARLQQLFYNAVILPPTERLPQLLREACNPLTLTVARGAALRLLARVNGLLQIAYTLTARTDGNPAAQEQVLMPMKTLPGRTLITEKRLWLQQGESLSIAISANMSHDAAEEVTVYTCNYTNNEPRPVSLSPSLTYDLNRHLRFQLACGREEVVNCCVVW